MLCESGGFPQCRGWGHRAGRGRVRSLILLMSRKKGDISLRTTAVTIHRIKRTSSVTHKKMQYTKSMHGKEGRNDRVKTNRHKEKYNTQVTQNTSMEEKEQPHWRGGWSLKIYAPSDFTSVLRSKQTPHVSVSIGVFVLSLAFNFLKFGLRETFNWKKWGIKEIRKKSQISEPCQCDEAL